MPSVRIECQLTQSSQLELANGLGLLKFSIQISAQRKAKNSAEAELPNKLAGCKTTPP